MPEGITYYDMKRMIEAQVPAGTYKLELHPRWFRSDNKTLTNPELVENLMTRSFEFSGAMVEHWGKALGIPLCDGIWLRAQFALHGHALPATTKEYLSMVHAWDNKNAKAEFNTTIFAAIVGEEMTIIFVDRNRLMTFTAIDTLGGTIPWYDPKLAPCPIREPDLYEKNLEGFQQILSSPARKVSIYREMTDSVKNNIWNGIGTSHAVEILHLARIHPETSTNDVFNNQEERARLFSAIRTFFQTAKSREYCQRVPAGKTSKNAFEFSPSVTRYYNGQFTKVYRKGSTLVSLPIYNELQKAGLLVSTARELKDGWESLVTKGGKEKKKRVPVYTIQMSTNSKDTKLTGDGEELTKNKPNHAQNKKGKSIFTYTCIYKQPLGAKGTILEEKLAVKKRLQDSGNTAEIGIASFMDTIKEIKKRKLDTKKTARRVSVREGRIGRPIKRKKTERELHAGVEQL